MPAISLETMQKILPQEKQQRIIDSVFGLKTEPTALEKAQAARDSSFQDWLNSRKAAVEQQRTDDVRMARLNAIGNALTTMVQPIGWAVGGATAGPVGYDNRKYLDAFNRAVKANDDLRNIGNLEDEYQFKLAEDEYQRQRAIADYEAKQKIELEKQKQIFDMRSQLNREQIEGRIKVAEANARAKYRFSTNGKKVTESVRDNLLKRANAAYAQVLADYYKKKNVGIENLQEPPSYDEFLKQFASQNGYAVAESQNAKEPDVPNPASGEDFSQYKRNGSKTSSSSNAATSGEDFSQYKRK